ncbi:hypothetical protein EAF04_005653 [Stromatinia cepivora]|nr:hypothetical protein EAF04_005653 [Stromatinia cepivora]
MAPPDWQAVQWDGGCGDGLFITIFFHYKRFHISILPPSSPSTIEGQLLSKFDTINDDDQDEVLTVQKEIEDIVYEAGGSTWTQLAPLSQNNTELSDLHSLLYPETFSFYFVTDNDKAALVQYETDKVQYDAFGMKIVNDINLPQYSSKDIRVLETLVGQGYITQVSAKGVEMCCKSGDDNFWQSIEREFDCLSKVARSKYHAKIRVPKLFGLVVSVDDGTMIGIL